MGQNRQERASASDAAILIGVGANLPSRLHGSPRQTCAAALAELERRGVAIERRSRWFETAPVPISDQPWYVNGVAAVRTELPPAELLALLHAVEHEFGRERREVNAARVIDLDLLAYGRVVSAGPQPPILPHPRMAERAFVLLPLADILPDWRHPATGKSVAELTAALPADQVARPATDE